MTTTFKCNLLLKTPLRLMNNFGFVWRYFCVTMSKKEMSPSYWFWWNCRMGGSIATICCWVMSLVHYRENFDLSLSEQRSSINPNSVGILGIGQEQDHSTCCSV